MRSDVGSSGGNKLNELRKQKLGRYKKPTLIFASAVLHLTAVVPKCLVSSYDTRRESSGLFYSPIPAG